MSPETVSDDSVESDGSPVNLLGFNLEFLGWKLLKILPHCLLEISSVVCLFKL